MWRPCRMRIKGVHPDIVHKVGGGCRRLGGEAEDAGRRREGEGPPRRGSTAEG
jgi:hypothetical protein